MTGFECSTFIWQDGRRRDYVALTGHDVQLREDYARVADLGIRVVREAIRWPVADLGRGRYDWSAVHRVLAAAAEHGLTIVWDLCHYGLPDGCDPFTDECRQQFASYCRAAAEVVARGAAGPPLFTPVNEISFFATAGSNMGWMYPFAKGRQAELKRALCAMAIAGARAIREVVPEARMVHTDPLLYVVPPPDRPDLAAEAHRASCEAPFEAWDMLAGRLRPELGGTPEVLDIPAVSYYSHCQAQLNPDGSRTPLDPRDPRRKPLSALLQFVWDRYRRPLLIGETTGFADGRAEWADTVMHEAQAALDAGVDLRGVCFFPFVDIPEWRTGEWARIGLYDVADGSTLARVPVEPYLEAVRRWQRAMHRPERDGAPGKERGAA